MAEVVLSDEVKEALRYVAKAWADGKDARFEFMNTKEVRPLVRLFSKQTNASMEYYDVHTGCVTRLRWTLPLPKWGKLFRNWMKHEGVDAPPLTLRLA